MAAFLREDMLLFLIFYVLTVIVRNNVNTLRNCTSSDFVPRVLPCNPETNKRTIVFYLSKTCAAYDYPQPITTHCQCSPGYGEFANGTNFSCKPCQPGESSPGGEIIDDWRNWNKSSVPGLHLNADTYCSDFLTGKPCNSWRMGGDGEYLVSGDYKNATELLCFEQSILSLTRRFYGSKSENKVRFKYKVNGAPCRRGATVCSHGLHVFVNEKERLHTDLQFQWTEAELTDLEQGYNRLKFVYHRSCTRDSVLDVAFIKYIAMFGTDTPAAGCRQCPKGTYSSKENSTMCTKCPQNEYQDDVGKNECKKCKINQFSRIGAIECKTLPFCTTYDYFLLPEHVNKCKKNETGTWIRNQQISIPKWPGIDHNSCREKPNGEGIFKRPAEVRTLCRCQPGYYLDTSSKDCERCTPGEFSDGYQTKCNTCGQGSAAIPGFYWEDFSEDSFPDKMVTQGCDGQYCDKQNMWLHRGSYVATRRLPGNFETYLNFTNIQIDYFDAKIELNCSIDCRMDPDGKQLAKHDHCFLKLLIMKGNKTIQDTDCVSRYRHRFRNGTMMKHTYQLKEPGNYTFFALFHHEDEASYSLVSYEARLHFVRIFGAKHGIAKECTICPAGTKVSPEKAFCEKCPKGTFSNNGSTTCQPCPDGFFSNKEGSAKCLQCGSGTRANAERDGCDYNGCTFQAADGIKYDLSSLKVVNGPMYRVKSYKQKTRYYFPLIYYVNICSTKHDNSSCMVYTRKVDPQKPKEGLKVVKETYLNTMACKRWSFDQYYSYSIGEVLNFIALPKENITKGLMINLTGGYNCWHKGKRIHSTPSTSILMKCDLSAGRGQPEPRSNFTAIDDKHCHFELTWRTAYACPLCTDKDYSKVYSECKDGSRYVTITRVNHCRAVNLSDISFHKEKCTPLPTEKPTPDGGSQPTKAPSSSILSRNLIIVIVVACLVILILIVFVVYFARRNRDLRTRIFVPGKSFSKVQEDDEDELVDNMQ